MIYKFPHDVLRRRCVAVATPLLDRCREDFSAMLQEAALTAPLGIAAPQVGKMSRTCLIRKGVEGDVIKPPGNVSVSVAFGAYINPVIIERTGLRRGKEMCLSIPGVKVTVERAESVVVEAWEVSLTSDEIERVRIEACGLAAVVWQHEIDHLDGVLMIDRISEFRFKTAMSDYRQKNRKEGWYQKKPQAAFRQRAVG